MTYNFAGAPILAALMFLSSMSAFSQSDALWTGQAQCQLTVQSPSYSYQEVQTWAISGAPSGNVSMAYPATWSVTGQGARQDLSGRQITVTQWQTSVPPMSASLAIFVNSANQLIIKSYHAQLRANAASTGLRQVTGIGVPQKPSSVSFVEFEWQFPQIEVEGTKSDVSGASSTPVNSGSGPLQPPGLNGTANCSWHFSKGPTNSTHATPAIRAITGTSNGAPMDPAATSALGVPIDASNVPKVTGTGSIQNPATPSSVPVTNAGPAVQAAPSGNNAGSSTPVSNQAASRTPVSNQLPPTLTPNTGQQATGALGVTIDHWNWKAGGKPDFGPGISVICTGAISDSSAKVALAITPSAALGPRSVTFSSSDGPIKSNFTVTSRTAQDFLLDPDNGPQNQAVILKLTGPIDTTTPQGKFELDFGSGVRATNASWISQWNAERVDLLIDPSAPPGPRTVVLTMNGSTQCPIVSSDAATGNYTWAGQVNVPVPFYFLGKFTVNSAAAAQTGQTTSSGTPPPYQTTGSTSDGTSSTSEGQQTVSQPVMNPPTASPGAGLVNLSWTTPSIGGGSSIDSYQVDTDSTSPARQWTITAPANTTAVALSACPYPGGVSCGIPNKYRFRIRAHTAAGYSPYSSYTSQVRPLVSYLGDNVGEVWVAKGCTSCHNGATSPNLTNGPNSYYNARAYVTPPSSSSKLLTCPTASTTCNTGITHSQNFTISSQEYQLIMQWILDGAQQ